MKKYIPAQVEKKVQAKWLAAKKPVDLSDSKKKFYLLVEFTYPSGDLHMGHWFAFAVPDILARFKRMQGYNVFAPNGFDAFGLPAENAAIKRGTHPQDWTLGNIEKMKGQFATMGAIYDWGHSVITCDVEYYRWNQWIFLKMLEKGLAYKGKVLSNWCPVDKTVLANENVENGKCWRCGAEVVQKEVSQWFLKITEYAEKLLWSDSENSAKSESQKNRKSENSDNLNIRHSESSEYSEIDWPKALKVGQNNWIGKSEGMEIQFTVDSSQLTETITVYTVYPETIFGVTFMVLAPEHPLVTKLVTKERKKEVDEYIKRSQKKSELERISLDKEKTGVFTGSYCTNPVNRQKVPIWIADYVIAAYGTGAVMGVPGSDHRDFAFAKKYDLPIVKVIASKPNDQSEVATDSNVLEQGYLVNSEQFDNLATPEPARDKIKDFLEEKGWGKRKVQYHLHDWSISRQRYWGTPIPVIYCEDCGTVPVPEKDLPVELPYEVDFAPKGKPPLATAEDWVKVKCPNCGKDATREVETMDTFIDSSWYYLRYLDPHNSQQLAQKDLLKDWIPVDIYFGGAEHTLGHTLYSRFFFKFLQEIGAVPKEVGTEYAKKRVHHGVILGPDGHRMSKSHGNVVNPDDEVKKYGADAVRLYLAFLGPYDLVAPWDPGGVGGVYHFLERVWKLADAIAIPENSAKSESQKVRKSENSDSLNIRHSESSEYSELSSDDLRFMHQSIKKVGEDIEAIKFNTAVSTLMTWLNHLSRKAHDGKISKLEYEVFLKLLSPFAPHITEELWESIGKKGSIHAESWPEFDEAKIKAEKVTIVVQINGRVRDKVLTEAGITQEGAEKLALALPRVQSFVGNNKPLKVIYIADRIINIVI